MKAFIRSSLEYCLAIMPNVKKWINKLDSLQHRCLCTMMGVNHRTSKNAVLSLTGMVDMKRRHEELSARFAYSNNQRPIGFMSHYMRQKSRSFLKQRSCYAQCESHPLLDDHDVLMQMHIEVENSRREAEGTIRIRASRQWTLNDTIITTRTIHMP
jgi:hypothetical protein